MCFVYLRYFITFVCPQYTADAHNHAIFYERLRSLKSDNCYYTQRNMSMRKLPYEVLLNELISVDFNDRFQSSCDKWQAHSNEYLQSPLSLPHRAFSVFLFNSQNKLLLQQRSTQKRTFPLGWTNTCCSHPNMVKLPDQKIAEEPIREAVHRAFWREFRLDSTPYPFYFMEKILYKQKGYKEDFGEFEVDYVYLSKAEGEVKFEDVPAEVADTKWVSRNELNDFVSQVEGKGGYITPWFKHMLKSGMIHKWWDMVEQGTLGNAPGEDEKKVINML